MTYTLDGAAMTSPEILHDYLVEAFALPAYYGRNLDALWDLLSARSRPYTIHLHNPRLGEIQLGPSWPPFFALLKDLGDCEGIDLILSGVGTGEIDPPVAT